LRSTGSSPEAIKRLIDELARTQANTAGALALAERIKREVDAAREGMKPPSA